MKLSEDLMMSVRSIQRRPVESFLLIFGIALGVGATAAGISMVSSTARENRETLSSPAYREIVVTIEERADDMDAPAVRQLRTDGIVLSTADLAAAAEVPDVQYAYVANQVGVDLRMPAFLAQGVTAMRAGGGAGGSAGSGEPGGGSGEPGGGSEEGSGAPAPAPETRTGGIRLPEIPEISGPEPVLDRISGFEVSPQFFDAWGLTAAEGSVFTDDDFRSGEPYMVLGSELAKSLFEDGQSLGRELLARMQLYRIIGILQPSGTRYDDMAFMTARSAEVPAAGSQFSRLVFRNLALHFTAVAPDRLDEARSQLEGWFSAKYGRDAVAISVPREAVEAARDRATRLTTLIFFLAVAGLFIASVNVSNILFGRAMRRQKSVGILKALGATVRTIFGLFFMEALFISVSGALLGAALSVLLTTTVFPQVMEGGMATGMLFLGVLVAWAITTTFTIVPARQASRIPAAEALRYE